ncbi:MAG: MBOAT family protein, partial [Oscillospiraceae bacterium]|nr:MBOAT family protein [Oscillospiraceae bacterium]
RTFLLMSMIRMFDCYRDVPLTFQKVGSMFTRFDLKVFTDGSLLGLGLSVADYVLLAVCLGVVLMVSLYKRSHGSVRDRLYRRSWLFYGAMGLLLVAILIFGAYGIGFDQSQFIYNQF